jgi:hypothetical protein
MHGFLDGVFAPVRRWQVGGTISRTGTAGKSGLVYHIVNFPPVRALRSATQGSPQWQTR